MAGVIPQARKAELFRIYRSLHKTDPPYADRAGIEAFVAVQVQARTVEDVSADIRPSALGA